MVARYKTYIIIGIVCFTLGYTIAGIGARGELHDLRVRAEQVERDNQQLRSELEFVQGIAENLQTTIRAAGETNREAAKSATDIKKSNRAIGKSIDTAIREIERSGDDFADARRILSEVQKRSRSKN